MPGNYAVIIISVALCAAVPWAREIELGFIIVGEAEACGKLIPC